MKVSEIAYGYKMKTNIENTKRIIVTLFFIIFFCIGISTFKDYGISTDEVFRINVGHMAWNYVINGDQALHAYDDKYHGLAFEILLVAAEKILGFTGNSRNTYLMRHFLTFSLFFIGVYFFYLLCKGRFFSWKIGLLGSSFLIVSPRIYADSFYNSKDIPCLVMYIISIYTLIKYLEKKTFVMAVLHAATSALLVGTRIVGILVPFLTVVFVLTDVLVLKRMKLSIRKILTSLIVYTVMLIIFTILFWPILWKSPLVNFVNALKIMSRYPWSSYNLYLGQHLQGGTGLPWHYVPLWLIITTPLAYVFLFLLGISVSIKSFLRNPRSYYVQNRNDLIFILWLFLPILSVISLNSVLYNGWRQMFFIYPAFLMLSLIGLTSLSGYIRSSLKGFTHRMLSLILFFAMSLSLLGPILFMVRYHPYQNLYFNMLIGGTKGAKNKFDLDYWGLTYRKGLEYILRNDVSDTIKFTTFYPFGKNNALILPLESRSRLVAVESEYEAKYLLTNFRGGSPIKWHLNMEYPYNKYYALKIEDVEVLAVYKLKD
jgi:hypothetical protein